MISGLLRILSMSNMCDLILLQAPFHGNIDITVSCKESFEKVYSDFFVRFITSQILSAISKPLYKTNVTLYFACILCIRCKILTYIIFANYHFSVEDYSLWLFWKRRRYVVAVLAFFGFFNVYSLRVNLSIAIVSMTENRTVVHENGTTTYVSIL